MKYIACFFSAYHVDNNRDLFYKEILEGIFIILIGKVCSFESPLVIVGGNRKLILKPFSISIFVQFIRNHSQSIYAAMIMREMKNFGL